MSKYPLQVLPAGKRFFEAGSATNASIQIPTGCKGLRATLTGGGGSGDFGRNGLHAAGGGRGCIMQIEVFGTLGGKVLDISTAGFAYNATATNQGNIGAQTTLAFDNGWTHIAGGGQRANGVTGGCGGNAAEVGTPPPYVSEVRHSNLASEIGQNATADDRGIGAGQGDTGGGGNGGRAGNVGEPAQGGWIDIKFYY